MELLLITIFSFVSALVTSVFGFGAGLVLTPLLGIMMPLTDALGIASLVFLFTAGSKTLWYYRDINWQVYRPAFTLSLVGLLLGFVIISYIDVNLLETGYGVLLIYFAVNMLRNTDQTKALLPKSSYPVFGGVLSVLMHSGGVFFFRYGQFFGLDRLQMVGTIAAIHFSMNIFKAGFFTGSGIVDVHYLYTLTPAYLAAIIGTRIGRSVLKRYVNERMFSIGVASLLLVLTLKYLV
ncbi:sulfite exporter TauE/SafE family protein [Malonomonas rubra]|uniref:sulfite exporter TauE/SafE family protein n=1 Tax=Malonomonas rubra TaxID=57040 RepID=UPI0026EA7A19|nr:sulfite exporter TauE/SafE family protein [Malonomonas rubra]